MSASELWKYVSEIPSESHRKWVTDYLNGVPTKEIAQAAKKPISLVQMIIKTIFSKRIEYYDLLYSSAFQKYNFDATSFCRITGEDVAVFRYLHAVYTHGAKPVSHIVYDNTVPGEWKDTYRAMVHEAKHPAAKPAEAPAAKTVKAASYRAKEKKIFQRIKRRVSDQFDRKFYLGDILIRDNEYPELISYARVQAMYVASSQAIIVDAPLFAVALVQIGIRHYNGNFWQNAANELKIENTHAFQAFAGKTFISTLQKHGKFIVSESERVSSILLHTFVSNFYSKGIYEFLFQYYVRDLERDINRNTREQMQALMETFQRKSNLGEKDSESFANQFTGRVPMLISSGIIPLLPSAQIQLTPEADLAG